MDQVQELIEKEEKRQRETLMLIPSENYASKAVRAAMGSVFSNKYAEGYPGKRYYQGNAVVDDLERLCQERAKKLFGVPHVNVQPLSGAAANLAIIMGLRQGNNDIQLSQLLSEGGHLSMGQNVSVTNIVMPAMHYHMTPEGEIDFLELERLALKNKPRIIWAGGTAYTKVFDWKRYREIADKWEAFFVADISHIGGLVAGGAHPSPVPFADVVMTTTHKTLRGPRGAMIMVTDKGLSRDGELGKKIDMAVFPGVQGGPHIETMAALCVALQEASNPEFKDYAKQIVVNAKAMAAEMDNKKYELVGGGSENHMVWIDLTNKEVDGWTAAWAMEACGMIANRQTVPGEKKSAYYPSGLRLGTPGVTTRCMKEAEMRQIAGWIDQVIQISAKLVKAKFSDIGGHDMARDQAARKMFKEAVKVDDELIGIAKEVGDLCLKFPVPE